MIDSSRLHSIDDPDVDNCDGNLDTTRVHSPILSSWATVQGSVDVASVAFVDAIPLDFAKSHTKQGYTGNG